MIQVSDPDCLALETNRDMEALRELGGAMLLAAACRNDSESTLQQYGDLLDGIVAVKASWDGGKSVGVSRDRCSCAIADTGQSTSGEADQFKEIMDSFNLDSFGSFTW
jgi:hypothetical protein